MTLDAVRAHRAITRDWSRVLDTLAALDAAGWGRPTRCHGWSLADLARHAAWGTSMEADALRRAREGVPGSGEGVEPPAGTGPRDVLAALRGAVTALGDELARAGDLGPDGMVTIPFGTIPVGFGLDVFTMEAGVHADDVAAAVGRDEPLGEDVVAATVPVLSVVLPALPALAGGAERPAPGTVVALTGPSVSLTLAAGEDDWATVDDGRAVTATARGDDDTTILRYALGRTGPDDPRLTLTGGAEALKRWFPGP